jgi:hypothetical protein
VHGPVTYPKDHKLGMVVPVGGSNCDKCEYVSQDKKKCSEPVFIKWNGSSVLPAPADRYCCDEFEPAPGTMSKQRISEAVKHGH